MSESLSLKVLFGEYVKSFQFKMGKTWCIIWLPPPSLLHKIIIRLHIINIIFISSRIKSKAEQKQFASCGCNNCVCRVYLLTVLLCSRFTGKLTTHTLLKMSFPCWAQTWRKSRSHFLTRMLNVLSEGQMHLLSWRCTSCCYSTLYERVVKSKSFICKEKNQF